MDSEPYKRARPAGPYTSKPPNVPIIGNSCSSYMITPLRLTPSHDNVDPAFLSNEHFSIITQDGLEQVAHDSASNWNYSGRRSAQPILDYLYLGPSSVTRNREWLQAEGITMFVAARDSRQADLNLMVVDKIAQELGIEARYVDVSGYQELIRTFPAAIRMINDHIIRIHQQSADKANGQPCSKRAKVLVFCETGNGRSAGIVTAYLMSVLGISLEDACQFVSLKRFCVSMDDDLKQILKSYEELVVAQRTVHRHQLDATPGPGLKRTKRDIDEIIADDDDQMAGMNQYPGSDGDRFSGREGFVPFIDT
ncbi:phosphatases II [Xylaria sp. CBS 124048]|nr:phosphatases II [Xylaria sp. CBS 124048]